MSLKNTSPQKKHDIWAHCAHRTK